MPRSPREPDPGDIGRRLERSEALFGLWVVLLKLGLSGLLAILAREAIRSSSSGLGKAAWAVAAGVLLAWVWWPGLRRRVRARLGVFRSRASVDVPAVFGHRRSPFRREVSAWPLILPILLLVGVGLIFERVFGNVYLAVPEWQLSYVMPNFFSVAWLLWLLVLFPAGPWRYMAAQMPTVWLRWVAWPFFAALLAGFCILGVQGWVAAASRIAISRQATIEIVVLVNEESLSTRGYARCHQRLELRYAGGTHKVCADKFAPVGRIPLGRMTAQALLSPLGAHLQSLNLAHPQEGP